MRWIAAFPKALSAHLRTDGDLRKDLQGVLTPQEVEAIARSSENGPNYVLQVRPVLLLLHCDGRLPRESLRCTLGGTVERLCDLAA